MKNIQVSIVIPTYNNETSLPGCLKAIEIQDYPKKLVEIVVADGGSTDKTREIAEKHNCTLVDNTKRLAEYGVALGIKKAHGEVIVILACDNELADKNYLSKIITPFILDKNIVLSYPKQDSSPSDTWMSKYINTFTDPISHFIYWNASNTRTFKYQYQTLIQKNDYSVFSFSAVDFPLIALAQGTAFRKNIYEKYATEGDDIFPIILMIKNGYNMAYVESAVVYHHTLETLGQFMRKQRWAFDNYLLGKQYGANVYGEYYSVVRKIRKTIWPLYAISIVFPFAVALLEYILTGKKEWLYHPILTFVTLYCLVAEYFRVILLKQKDHINRK